MLFPPQIVTQSTHSKDGDAVCVILETFGLWTFYLSQPRCQSGAGCLRTDEKAGRLDLFGFFRFAWICVRMCAIRGCSCMFIYLFGSFKKCTSWKASEMISSQPTTCAKCWKWVEPALVQHQLKLNDSILAYCVKVQLKLNLFFFFWGWRILNIEY